MFNPFLLEFCCVVCGQSYTPKNVTYTCPSCELVGVLDTVYDFDRLRIAVSRESISNSREQTMWRYRALLPLANDAPTPPLPVGGTPLITAPRLAETFDLA